MDRFRFILGKLGWIIDKIYRLTIKVQYNYFIKKKKGINIIVNLIFMPQLFNNQ
jgi:hypothetical protein